MTCNNDIFAPAVCEAQWRACATAEQIHIFLWQQLGKLKIFTYDFYQSQLTANQDYDGRITTNSNDIRWIKDQITSIDSSIATLKANFADLQADNAAFKVAINNSIITFQNTLTAFGTNLDSLTQSYQALDNRVGILEKQTDLAKLQEIIKSYEQIKEETNQMIADYIVSITYKSGDPINNDGKLCTAYQAFAWVNGVEENVDIKLAAQDTKIQNQETKYNEFMARINATVSDNEKWMKEQVNNLMDQIGILSNTVASNYQDLMENIQKLREDFNTEVKRLDELMHSIDDSSKARDNVLQGNLDHLEQDIKTLVATKEQESKDRDTNLDNKIDANWNKHQVDIDNLMSSDTRQWDTINGMFDIIKEANDRSKVVQDQLTAFKTEQDKFNQDISQSVDTLEQVTIKAADDINTLDKRGKAIYCLRYPIKGGETVNYDFGVLTVNVTANASGSIATVTVTINTDNHMLYDTSYAPVASGSTKWDAEATANTYRKLFLFDTKLDWIVPAEFHVHTNTSTTEILFTLIDGVNKHDSGNPPEPTKTA